MYEDQMNNGESDDMDDACDIHERSDINRCDIAGEAEQTTWKQRAQMLPSARRMDDIYNLFIPCRHENDPDSLWRTGHRLGTSQYLRSLLAHKLNIDNDKETYEDGDSLDEFLKRALLDPAWLEENMSVELGDNSNAQDWSRVSYYATVGFRRFCHMEWAAHVLLLREQQL